MTWTKDVTKVKTFLNYKFIIPIAIIIFILLMIFNPLSLLPGEHTVVIAEEKVQSENLPKQEEKQGMEKNYSKDKADEETSSGTQKDKEGQKSPHETEKNNEDKKSSSETQNDHEAVPPKEVEEQKVAYLTFDDGPSKNVTPYILDILKEYQIKATFFVIGSQAQENPEILKRIEAEGHMVANHTFSHNYKYLYASPKNFLKDLEKNEKLLDELLSNYSKTGIIRFPGGSFGKSKAATRKAVINEGYQYIDWNVVSGDAEGNNIPPAKQLNRLMETLENKKSAVILMHDANTKQTTIDALPRMIEYIQSQDYVFKTMADYEF